MAFLGAAPFFTAWLFLIRLAVTRGIRALPDMYALCSRAYISGKALVPVLQLLHRSHNVTH